MSQSNGQINVKVSIGDAVTQLKAVRTGLTDLNDAALTTNRRLDDIRKATQSSRRYLTDIKNSVNELVTAYREQTKALESASRATQRANTSMQSHGASLGALATAYLTLTGAVKLFQDTLSVSIKIDSLTKTFYAITGSMAGANVEMNYVKETAQRLGLDFFALAESYKGFSAAAKFANMDAATTKQIFTSVSESATVLGLSGEKTKLVLMALEQMISKGVVSMEELRRQLGDSLPGAFELGAKAMGLTLQEFNKLVASGKLMTDEFLPKFARTMSETYGTLDNVAAAIKTPRAQIQMLMNELTFAADKFSRDGFLQGVVKGVKDLREALASDKVQNSIRELGEYFGNLVSVVISFTKMLLENSGAVKVVIAALIGLKAGMLATQAATLLTSAAMTLLTARSQLAAVKLTDVWKNAATAGGALTTFAIRANLATAAVNPLIGLVGLLASAIGYLVFDNFLRDTKTADDFVKEFGGSVEEAEAQVKRFNAEAAKNDPLEPYRKSVDSTTSSLAKMTKAADEAMQSALNKQKEKSGFSFTEMLSKSAAMSAVDEGFLSQEDVERMFPQRQLDKSMQTLLANITDFQKKVSKQMFKTSEDLMSALAPLQEAYRAALANPETKAQAETMADVWKVTVKQGTDYASLLVTLNAQQQELAKSEFLVNWTKNVGLSTDAVEKLRAALGKKFATGDFTLDMKNLDSAFQMYEKLWGKTLEGKNESNKEKDAQIEIDGMRRILEARASLKNAQIQMDIEVTKSEKLKTEMLIAETELRIGAMGEEQAAIARLQITNMQKINSLRDTTIEGYTAQIKANTEEVEKWIKRQGAVAAQNLKDRMKGQPKGGGVSRTDNWIVSMKDKVRDASTELTKLQEEYDRLQTSFANMSQSNDIAKVFDDASIKIRKLHDDITQLEDKYAQLQKSKASKGDLSTAAAQLEALRQENALIEEQINKNARLAASVAYRKQVEASLKAQADVYGNTGQYDLQYEAQKQLIALQIQAREEGIKTKQAQIDEMNTIGPLSEAQRMQMDSFAESIRQAKVEIQGLNYEGQRLDAMNAPLEHIGFLMKEGVKKGAEDTKKQLADMISSIPMKVIDGFANSLVTAFAAIADGSKSAGEAFAEMGKSMLKMIYQLIQELMVLIIKTMILNSLKGTSVGAFLGLADGGVISGGSVSRFANGGVVSGGGGRLIPFASGGVLTGPQLFGTRSGDTVLAGEAGPEAFVPLGRTREGKLGIETTNGIGGGGAVMMVVNVYNNASDKVGTSQQQGTDENGNPRLDVFIEQIDTMLAGRVGSGTSQLGRAIDKTRGTSTAKGLYT